MVNEVERFFHIILEIILRFFLNEYRSGSKFMTTDTNNIYKSLVTFRRLNYILKGNILTQREKSNMKMYGCNILVQKNELILFRKVQHNGIKKFDLTRIIYILSDSGNSGSGSLYIKYLALNPGNPTRSTWNSLGFKNIFFTEEEFKDPDNQIKILSRFKELLDYGVLGSGYYLHNLNSAAQIKIPPNDLTRSGTIRHYLVKGEAVQTLPLGTGTINEICQHSDVFYDITQRMLNAIFCVDDVLSFNDDNEFIKSLDDSKKTKGKRTK